MFKWLNKQGVQSSKGFIVQSIDRFTIEYRENNKCISIYVEHGLLPDKKVIVYIEPGAFDKWDDGTLVPREKQIQIFQNFKEAMEFQEIGVVVN